MFKLSNLIQNTNSITEAAAPSQFAMHALSRDSEGLLTYTKILWANTSETVDLTFGDGFAYNGIEELVTGVSQGGVQYNLTAIDESISGAGDTLNKNFVVRVVTANGVPAFTIDGDPAINPTLNLIRGSTYKFDTSDPSTENHPFFISTQPGGNTYAYEYLEGITNSRTANTGEGFITVNANVATSDPLQFKVPMDAPSQLYYASGQDANTYGTITISTELTNTNKRRYEQIRFDNQKLNYYVNSNGYLVARYGADYNYS